MILYAYALLDTDSGEYSPLMTYPTDQIAGYEIIRNVLTVDNDLKPVTLVEGKYVPCDDFVGRYRLMRLAIYNTGTGLVDGSCERVDIVDCVKDAIQHYCDYFNGGNKHEG